MIEGLGGRLLGSGREFIHLDSKLWSYLNDWKWVSIVEILSWLEDVHLCNQEGKKRIWICVI